MLNSYGVISVGAGVGAPDVSAGLHGGITIVKGAGPGEAQGSLLGIGRYTTAKGEIEEFVEASGSLTWSRAYNNLGGDGYWVPGQPVIDQRYQGTIDAVSLNAGVGFDVLSYPAVPADVNVSHGMQGSGALGDKVFNIYAPVQWLLGPLVDVFVK